jgi:hypothetical protein
MELKESTDMPSTHPPLLFPTQSRQKKGAPTLWGALRSGVISTLNQFQSKACHPAFTELKRQRDAHNARPTMATKTESPQPPITEQQQTDPPKQPLKWTLVLSDTDNDIETTLYTLWLTGLCDEKGVWNPGLNNIQVVHTGDWLNKWKPSPKAVAFYKNLKETAPPQCPVTIINGNHELSVLKMADDGITTPLSKEDLGFIRNQEILHTTQNTLFIHGYPSLELSNILLQMRREELDLESFANRIKTVFFDKNRPLYSHRQGMEIIGDLRKPKLYYEKRLRNHKFNRGREIAEILQSLGIQSVIHGHKPCDNTQIDQELSHQLPGIRLVNNDNRIKQTGLGGLLLNDKGEILFINPTTMKMAGGEKSFRKKLKKRLKTRRKDLDPSYTRAKNNKPNLVLVA